jgi:hypothetical protein
MYDRIFFQQNIFSIDDDDDDDHILLDLKWIVLRTSTIVDYVCL